MYLLSTDTVINLGDTTADNIGPQWTWGRYAHRSLQSDVMKENPTQFRPADGDTCPALHLLPKQEVNMALQQDPQTHWTTHDVFEFLGHHPTGINGCYMIEESQAHEVTDPDMPPAGLLSASAWPPQCLSRGQV